MNPSPGVLQLYRKGARRYDLTVALLDLASLFSIRLMRKEAVQALELQHGDTVMDLGCGTGLNFPLLQAAVGEHGKVIGVDLCDAMLSLARRRVEDNGWRNVHLVLADAAQVDVSERVGGVLSTFALILIPQCAAVIENGCRLLAPGRRWALLDLAWPAGYPLWLRRVFFVLQPYGVNEAVLRRRPWQAAYQAMQERLAEVMRKEYWFGFFYLGVGRKRET